MAVENIKKNKAAKGGHSLIKILLRIILAIILVVALYVGFITFKAFITLPDWNAIEQSSNSVIYDDQGVELVKLHKGENRTPVSLDQIPQNLINGFVATEDTRFYKHFGVDIKRVLGAALVDIKAGSIQQGASTITMQLARNAILESQEKELERKIKEAFLAIKIEQHYTKDEIMEFYLNAIYFNHGAYGVQEASQVYFDKDVSELTLDECAILVGIVRNPTLYSPKLHPDNSKKVRNTVLDNMVRYEYITEDEANAAKAKPIKTKNGKLPESGFDWMTDYVIDEAEKTLVKMGYESSQLYTGGFRVYSTASTKIQDSCEDVYDQDSLFPDGNSSDPVQSAMVVMDSKTGAIKGMIGGRKYETRRGYNRAADMTRQPGSVFKPISVYAAALEEGYGPNYMLNNSLTDFGGGWTPRNQNGSYSDKISMRNALRISANIPAVSMLETIGVSKGYDFAIKVGQPLVKQDKNLSLALGGLTYGVSPVNLAGAYGTFANQGIYNEPYAIDKITDLKGNVIYQHKPAGKPVMSPQSAYAMTDMLEGVIESGTGTKGRLSRPAAGKTGTTQLPDKPEFNNRTGNKDAWWAGYTPDYVGVVWMGYDSDKSSTGKAQYLTRVYGGQYPVKLWKKVMNDAHEGLPVSDFTRPDEYKYKESKRESKREPEKITLTICTETNMIANKFCPSTKKKQYDKDSGSIPQAVCNVHKELPLPDEPKPDDQPDATNVTTVTICTAGGGLPNYPKGNETGGCPSGNIKQVKYPANQVPKGHCGIASHQVRPK